jgi:tetratricopeptide (TPR) repeat protein
MLAGQAALAIEAPAEQEERTPGVNNPAAGVDRRVLDQARDLLDRRQSKQAYELLAPHEYDWAGEPEYDALLGAAAMASGRPGEAIMPLERATAADPGDVDARLALARAYSQAGEPELARAELDQLGLRGLPADPYAAVRPAVAARPDAGARERRFRYYVMFDTGYDSNANAGTDQGQFLGLVLSRRNVEAESGYSAVSNGGILHVPLSSAWAYDFKFNFVQRRNYSATFANTDRAGLSNDFIYRGDYTRLRFGAGLYTVYLDSRLPYDGDYAQSGAVLDFGARWRMGDSSWQLGPDVIAAAIRHDNSIRVFDVDQLLHGMTLEYLGEGPLPSFGIALVTGEAQAVQSGSPYGRDQHGASFTSSWPVGRPGRMYSFMNVLRSNYDGLFFGGRRHDTRYSTGLSAVLHVFPSRNWSLIPHLAWIRNDSDVSLFDYDRWEIGLGFRWYSD